MTLYLFKVRGTTTESTVAQKGTACVLRGAGVGGGGGGVDAGMKLLTGAWNRLCGLRQGVKYQRMKEQTVSNLQLLTLK